MQNSLAVVDERVGHLARLHVPHSNRRVTRSTDDDFVVVLQTQYGTRVTCEDLKIRRNKLRCHQRAINKPTLLHCNV
jgi:hypothetical protein